MQLSELELTKHLYQYNLPPFDPNAYEAKFACEQPTSIHHSEKLERDTNGRLITQPIPVSEFEQKISASRGFPFTFKEGVFTKKTNTKNNYSPTFQFKQPSADAKNFADRVAVIRINAELGYGLFVIDPKGLPKNTKFIYSSCMHAKDELPTDLMDTYRVTSPNDTAFTSLFAGGLSRFIQGAPRKDQLGRYLVNTSAENVAASNVEFIFDKSGFYFYETIEYIPYGAQILAHHDYDYWYELQKAFRIKQQLFDLSGRPLSEAQYQPPILWLTSEKDQVRILPFSTILPLRDNPEIIGTTRDEIDLLIAYLPKRFQTIFSSEIPSFEQWKNFNHGWPFKCLCSHYKLHYDSDRSLKFFSNVNSAAVKAYKAQDYKTAIKLLTWLVMQESMIPDKTQKRHTLASYYWNLGNAYWHWNNHSEHKTVFHLLDLAAEYDQGYAERVRIRKAAYEKVLNETFINSEIKP